MIELLILFATMQVADIVTTYLVISRNKGYEANPIMRQLFGLPELGYKMHVDHIIPLSKGGRHVASNLQILPAGLNLRKGTKCPL